MSNYLIAAGGTGGHIYPGLAIAETISQNEPESKIIFCGIEKGMEAKLIPGAGYEIFFIEAMGFSFKNPFKFLRAVLAFFRGKRQSKNLIKEHEIDFVIGTGGYVCAPVLSAANSLKIKSLIHEQNLVPGKANKIFAAKVDAICLSYEESTQHISSKANTSITGNPVRKVFKGLTRDSARKKLSIDQTEVLLYVTGGSLGARSINYAVSDMTNAYLSLGYRIIVSSGVRDYKKLVDESRLPKGIYEIKKYVPDQHLYMAAADLVLCRAGAITCSEIAVLGKASIMVPYPYAADDHQTYNARAFENKGANILIKDSSLDAHKLYNTIAGLIFNREKLNKMEEAARELAYPDASDHIYEQIKNVKKIRT